jgi:hypothetical protein
MIAGGKSLNRSALGLAKKRSFHAKTLLPNSLPVESGGRGGSRKRADYWGLTVASVLSSELRPAAKNIQSFVGVFPSRS